MDVLTERRQISESYLKTVKDSLGLEEQQKVKAILAILEIGKPSIAHAVALLHVCEDTIMKCSTLFDASMDD